MIVLCLSVLHLWSQGASGSLTGLVRDPLGSSIPQAKLTLVNAATQEKLTAGVTEAGSFNFPNIKIGRYELTIEADGFRRMVIENVYVEAGAPTRVDVTMEVGGTAESISVRAEPPLLQTETSSAGTVVNRGLLDKVPFQLAGTNRDVTSFIRLVPGVVSDANNFNVMITGGRQHATEVLVDGVTNMYRGAFGSPFSIRPSMTSVSEFRVETAVPPAEYGRTSSGVVIMTTKSGTNDLHGNAEFLVRNNVLDARRYNARQADITRQGEGAFNLGGPVMLPKLYKGRSRTFFFTDVTVFRRINEPQGIVRTVGTLPMRSGDFSAVPQIIFDPEASTTQARTPFPDNRIPANRISTFARNLLEVIPPPNLPTPADNFTGSQRNIEKMTVFLIKLDHNFNDRHRTTLIGRPSWNVRDNYNGPWGPARLEGFYDKPYAPHINMSYDWIITPSLLNRFTAGYTNWFSLFLQTPSIRYQVPGSFGPGFPVLLFAGQGLSRIGENVDRTVGSNLINFQDSLSYSRGRHNYKFGFRFDWLEDNTETLGNRNGTYTFSPVTTSFPARANTGHAFASFLLGAPSTAAMQFGFPILGRSTAWGFYAQDDWKATSRLTLNYGLRYEIQEPWYERDGNVSNLDLALPNAAAGGLPGAYVYGGRGDGRTGQRRFVDNYYRGFGPRLGLAYQLTSRTVFRAGAGIFYAPRRGTGLITDGFSSNVSVSSLDGGLSPAFFLDAGWPSAVAVRPPFIDPTRMNGLAVSHVNRDGVRGSGRLSRTYQSHVGIQQRLGPSLFEVAWVSTQARHIPNNTLENLNQVDPRYLALGNLLTRNISDPAVAAAGFGPPFPGFRGTLAQALRPFPQFQTINYIDSPSGNTNYHALLAKFEQRFSSGLTLLASYAFSKNITDTEQVLGSYARLQNNQDRRSERAVANIDTPHRWISSVAYDLPFGKGRRWLNNGLAAQLLGGWSVAGILSYQSGQPLRITIPNNLPLFTGQLRPNLAPGVNPFVANDHASFRPFNSLTVDRGDVQLNAAAFVAPPPFTFGNLAPYLPTVRSFGFSNEDISLAKRFVLREGQFVELRTDWFNMPNRRQLNAPVTDLTSPNFGRITGQKSARVIQLGMRYSF